MTIALYIFNALALSFISFIWSARWGWNLNIKLIMAAGAVANFVAGAYYLGYVVKV